ncbi:hypothetical protein AN477_14115 [Alicyclobacillus ferrooxydans]|uniref:Uncharacterized protein n=1 Tax=Alicyclobacillus ferrooxydans TaxID=471514 RepID=A0A0P9D0Q5_9BACL|nr:hypothetical protein AN477_14115 [Alicyclobacillus ferrooxydans]
MGIGQNARQDGSKKVQRGSDKMAARWQQEGTVGVGQNARQDGSKKVQWGSDKMAGKMAARRYRGGRTR